MSRFPSPEAAARLVLAQVADHARVELALHEPDHAVDLLDRQLEPRGEPVVGRADQRAARALEPARGGRAVHAERGADLVDRQLVDDLLAQQRAVLGRQLGDRLAQRDGELGAVLGLERVERRIDRRPQPCVEALSIGVSRARFFLWRISSRVAVIRTQPRSGPLPR